MMFSPNEVLATLVDQIPSLATSVQDLLVPVRKQRDDIRRFLEDQGLIQPVLTMAEPIYGVGATDGAFIVSPMMIGDHVSCLSVAVAETTEGSVGVVDHSAWSDFIPHSPDAEVLAKGVMMGGEISLIPSLGEDRVKIIDGSYATPFIAVNMGLASADETVRQKIISLGDQGLVEAAEHIAETSLVVACPKSDSSTAVWAQCAAHLSLTGSTLTDKAMASLVLNPGEMLVSSRSNPSWEFLYASQGRVRDPGAKTLADKLTDALRPLTAHQVTAHLVKPPGSTGVVRVETHPGLDMFEADEIIHAVCANTGAPFIQEPLCQYVADLSAKSIAATADVQMESARFELAQDPETYELLEYLIHSYRTS